MATSRRMDCNAFDAFSSSMSNAECSLTAIARRLDAKDPCGTALETTNDTRSLKHAQASAFATLSVFAPHQVHARVEERAVRVFAPNVRGALFGEETRLHVLGAHAVHHQPREHVSGVVFAAPAGSDLRQSLELTLRVACGRPLPRGGGDGDELRHLQDDDELEALPSANLAHAPRALRVISQRHVFSERHLRHTPRA